MRKKDRLQLLREILIEENIQKQEDLVVFLKNRGIEITQATISRDFSELQLIKTLDEKGEIRYILPNFSKENDYHFSKISPMINDIIMQEIELMMYVVPGTALRVKQVLLRTMKAEIFAAIADDDGVFVKAWSQESAQKIFNLWKKENGGI
ncbi:MAG: hypothetical protein LBT69_00155 [Lactobacillales bacterium]|jgi:transcriptional regulator of arginine metabolism|nr:hypothetical protein [Lactobacillales bacterium]